MTDCTRCLQGCRAAPRAGDAGRRTRHGAAAPRRAGKGGGGPAGGERHRGKAELARWRCRIKRAVTVTHFIFFYWLDGRPSHSVLLQRSPTDRIATPRHSARARFAIAVRGPDLGERGLLHSRRCCASSAGGPSRRRSREDATRSRRSAARWRRLSWAPRMPRAARPREGGPPRRPAAAPAARASQRSLALTSWAPSGAR
jgi:hypothetical protein